MNKQKRKNIYGFRKSKVGLTTALLTTLFIGASYSQEVFASESKTSNTITTNSEEDISASDNKLTLTKKSTENDVELTTTNPSTAEVTSTNEENTAKSSAELDTTIVGSKEEATITKNNHDEDSTSTSKESSNFITENSIKPGDFKISGKTKPNSYVFIDVDGDAKSSFDNPLIADEKGNFSLDLGETPIYYGQKITISSYSPEALESEDEEDEEDESGIAEKTIDIPLHKDAYTRPTQRLTKKDNKHQVLIDPIYVGQNKIKGHTSVKGKVTMNVNNAFVTVENKIAEDGAFETKLQPVTDVLKFRKGDLVYLSFISEDGEVVIQRVHIRDFKTDGKEEEPNLTSEKITSNSPRLSGHHEADAQVHLYDAETGNFITEAISDENGKYSEPLYNIKSGQKLYRIFIGADNTFKKVTIDTVDGANEDLDKKLIPAILDKLEIFGDKRESEISNANPIYIRNLSTQTTNFIGRSIFPNTYVKWTSSIKGKQYPPLLADELGYFGVDIRDIQRKFEKDEKITFQIMDPKTMATLATKEVTIVNIEEIIEAHDRSITMDNVTEDHGYLKGIVAPNLEIRVYKNGKSDDIIAKTMSDSEGNFEIDLGDYKLKEGDILSVVGFDLSNNQQIFWNYYPVGKGTGKRILKPILPPTKEENKQTTSPTNKQEPQKQKTKEKSIVQKTEDKIVPSIILTPSNIKDTNIEEINKGEVDNRKNSSLLPRTTAKHLPLVLLPLIFTILFLLKRTRD